MPFEPDGSLTTDKKSGDTVSWDTQTEWEAYQSKSDVTIQNGNVTLNRQVPTSGLQHQYDASQQSSASDLIDQYGGFNLPTANGSPTLVQGGRDGKNTIDMDFTDWYRAQFGSSKSQPIIVCSLVNVKDYSSNPEGDGHLWSPYDFNNGRSIATNIESDGSGYRIFSDDSSNPVGTTENGWQLLTVEYDGSNSYIRKNQTELGTQNASSTPDGITIGTLGGATDFQSKFELAEWLWYDANNAPAITDIEQYLKDKWSF